MRERTNITVRTVGGLLTAAAAGSLILLLPWWVKVVLVGAGLLLLLGDFLYPYPREAYREWQRDRRARRAAALYDTARPYFSAVRRIENERDWSAYMRSWEKDYDRFTKGLGPYLAIYDLPALDNPIGDVELSRWQQKHRTLYEVAHRLREDGLNPRTAPLTQLVDRQVRRGAELFGWLNQGLERTDGEERAWTWYQETLDIVHQRARHYFEEYLGLTGDYMGLHAQTWSTHPNGKAINVVSPSFHAVKEIRKLLH